jgi:hypothetical protein
VVAEPAEEGHPADEEDRDEQEREAEAGRVGRQPGGAAQNGVGVARRRERAAEERPDARCGADRERATQQHARAAAPRPPQQPAGDQPVRSGQEAEEREPGDDEDEAGDRPLRLVGQRARDEARGRPERDEHRRETGDERQRGDGDAPADAWVAETLRVDRGHGRQVAGHERQDAGERDRGETSEEKEPCLLHQAS